MGQLLGVGVLLLGQGILSREQRDERQQGEPHRQIAPEDPPHAGGAVGEPRQTRHEIDAQDHCAHGGQDEGPQDVGQAAVDRVWQDSEQQGAEPIRIEAT